MITRSFSDLARALEAKARGQELRADGPRAHHVTYVLPCGRLVDRELPTGLLKFNAGGIVRGREVLRIKTDASGSIIHSWVWLGAEVQA